MKNNFIQRRYRRVIRHSIGGLYSLQPPFVRYTVHHYQRTERT